MISVVIVNYNGRGLIGRSIECLLKQTFENYEIIVVDNASRDDSVAFIREKFPSVKVVEHPVNAGFSGGNLAGLKEAKGDFIALLNNDAFPEPNWLSHLWSGMDSNDRIGICASKLIIEGTDLIDSAGDGCTTAVRGYKLEEKTQQQAHLKIRPVFGACAGAALYRREMIDDIGFFDEDFFLIYEDADLNIRAQLAGWKCLFVPEAVVHHHVRSTIGHDSELAIYYSNRNADLLWIKNMPMGLMLRYIHHKLITELGAFVYFSFRKKGLFIFLKAKRDAIRLLPLMLKKRKKIQAMKRISNRAFSELLTPIWTKDYFVDRLNKLWKK